MYQIEKQYHNHGDKLEMGFEVTGLDLTGLSLRSEFKRNKDQDVPDIVFATADNSIEVDIISVVEGQEKAILTFKKTATQMKAIPMATYYYQITTFTTVDDEITIGEGVFETTKDITKLV
ncbi:MAG: hypothetical protein JNK73_13140 [Bacteroidia bacterium]|nr:hypothetical protein [Bacteroidia bacterium]